MPMLETLPDTDHFRTSTAHAMPEALRVDRKKNVIFGASLMQLGDVNDERPWTVDLETLEQAEEFANQSNAGLKARFTHPNMSNDGMGSYLGRWKNVTIDGDKLRGDLHLADSAFNSPSGDLASYVMDLAEEDPEAFGVSLASRIDSKAMESLEAKDKRTPIRFAALRAADVVDEPAATRGGLFNAEKVDLRVLPFQATMLLDAYFGDAEPAVVVGRVNSFLEKYFRTKGDAMAAALDEQNTDTAVVEQVSTPEAVLSEETTTEQVTEAAEAVETDTEDTALSVREAEKQRIRKIKVLCDLAECPDKFSQFVDADFSVEEVQFALKEIAPKRNTALSEQDNVEEPTASPDDNFRKEYRDFIAAGNKLSSTEDEYVVTRRIDEGLDTLEPRKAD